MPNSDDNTTFIEISRVLPLLPYAEQLDAYAEAAANGLKESLRRLLSSSTYVSHVSEFPDLIYRYITQFGVRFTKKELADIINFGLAVAFCPQVDKLNREKWKECVTFLLSLSHGFIEKEKLRLEWKTFQNAFMRDVNEIGNFKYTNKITDLESVLIDKAQRYFPSSCVQEIWDSEKATIYTSLATESFDGIFDHLQKFTPNQLCHFEKIKNVWLEEVFHIWYQYPAPKCHAAVVKLLAKFSQHFTGRLDMEPHLDRIFNFLTAFIYDKNTDRAALTASAELIVNSIVPNSNVLKMLRNFFKVCSLELFSNREETVIGNLPFFCFQLISLLCKRVNLELTWIPEIKEHVGEVVEWARLTKEQVDELVEILLPICLEDTVFCADQDSACGAMKALALLRPGIVIPHVMAGIKGCFKITEITLTLVKSVKFLASFSCTFCCPNVFPIWNYHIGFQPTDQLQNYPPDNQSNPLMKSPDQIRQRSSHFLSMIYPECRLLMPIILNICLEALHFDQENCLLDSVRTLTNIFITVPVKYISEIFEPEDNIEIEVVEELVLKVFRRVFQLLRTENGRCQDLINKDQDITLPSNTVRDLTVLAIHIAMSANSSPKLRACLFNVFLVNILQTSWNPIVFSKFPDILFWLLNGPRFKGTNLSESDTALHALHKFWPLFFRQYVELKTNNSVTREGKVDTSLIPLLNILQAFFVIFVPSRMEEVKANFIGPVIDILFELCNISLGLEGKRPPSIDLAKYASECLGVLLYRLLAISVKFSGVDLYNSAKCTTSPLWTPFVGFQKAKDLVKWKRPTKKTLFIAKLIVKRLLIPLLTKLAGVTSELRAYLKDNNLKRIRVPHITIHSKQPGITNQRAYLTSLITWIVNICVNIFEGLKPRNISHEDADYVNQICSELELLRHENVACPESSSFTKDFQLDLHFFDFHTAQDDSTLRDQIFRCGLQFLDALAKISTKFDVQTIISPGRSKVQCMIEKILDMKQLNLLLKVVGYAGFNFVESTKGEAYEFTTHLQTPIRAYCLGFHRDYIEPDGEYYGKMGPSSELLSALSSGQEPSLRCGSGGGGGIYGVSYLPIVWLMCAKRQHINFIHRAIGLNAVWPGTEALSLITRLRLPANRELNQFVETLLQIALNCINKDAEKFAVNLYYLTANEVPGVPITLARLLMDVMQPFSESTLFIKSEAEYPGDCFRLKRVVSIISLLVSKTAFSIELYNNDPTLWSQLWVALMKLCIPPNFADAKFLDHQIAKRVNDQRAVADMCSVALKTLEKHPHTLYFPASYEPATHSTNSPLRHLIRSAQKMLITLGGRKKSMVKYEPNILVKTASLRREAHRYLIRVIDEVCLQDNDDTDPISHKHFLKLLSNRFKTEYLNSQSAYADVETLHKSSLTPP